MDQTGGVAQLLQCRYAEEVWWEGVAPSPCHLEVGVGVQTRPHHVGVEQVLVQRELQCRHATEYDILHCRPDNEGCTPD